MKKIFKSGMFEIEVADKYVAITRYFMQGYGNNWTDAYNFLQNGVVLKEEIANGWSRDEIGLYGLRTAWRKRIGWSEYKKELEKAETFEDALKVIKKIDEINLAEVIE